MFSSRAERVTHFTLVVHDEITHDHTQREDQQMGDEVIGEFIGVHVVPSDLRS